MDVEKNIDDEKKDAIVDQNENIRNDEGEIEDIEDIEESEESTAKRVRKLMKAVRTFT